MPKVRVHDTIHDHVEILRKRLFPLLFQPMRYKPMSRILPLLVTLICLPIYIATAAPSIVTFFDDTLEFQLVAPSLGIAHPTGYPLYTLLGAAWSRILLPFGNWAWRMNILSAVTASVALGLLVYLTRQLFDPSESARRAGTSFVPYFPSWLGALMVLVPALLFGFGSIWWQQATIAEVYALHGLFVIAILLATVRVGRHACMLQASASRASTSGSSGMILLCLLLGLSLTHHRTTVLLLPGIGIYLFWTSPHLFHPQRSWFMWTLALITPLLLYGYIPLRAAQGIQDLHGSYENSLAGFLQHIAASSYSQFFGWNERVFPLLLGQVGWWGALAALWGAVVLGVLPLFSPWRQAWSRTAKAQDNEPAWTLLVVLFATNLLFALFYRVADVEVFLLPSLLILALFIGGGLTWLACWVQDHSPRLLWLYAPLAFFIALSPLVYNGPVDRSQTWEAHDLAIEMAKVNFPSNSYFVGLEGEATALHYMQQAEGLAQNVTPLWANDDVTRRALVDDLMSNGESLYLSRELPGIEERFSFSGDGPLIRVWPRGGIEPIEPSQRLDLALLGGMLLLDGYDLVRLDEAGGPTLRVTFYWRPQVALTQRMKLSLRLVDLATGEAAMSPTGEALIEDRFPLRQATFSDNWLPGEQIRDVQYLTLPELDQPPLTLLVILYDADTIQEMGRVSINL